jgi:hypothetical protein
MPQSPYALALALSLVAGIAGAEPAYLDDRSTPEAVIRSLYNAVNRHEVVRAYSYWEGSGEVPDFAVFSAGYAETDHVELRLGTAQSDGAAGSIFTTVPVAIRSLDTGGKVAEFAGCYTLRQVEPGIQAVPPFQPIHIVSGKLRPVTGGLQAAVPTGCDP